MEEKLLDFQHYYDEIITSIERMRDAKGSRRKRAMPIAHEQISVVIDGRSIVEAYTKRRLLHDLVIRHPQVLAGRKPHKAGAHEACGPGPGFSRRILPLTT